MLFAFTVKRRKRAKAANASDARLADRPELVDNSDVHSEIWRYFAYITTLKAIEVHCCHTVDMKMIGLVLLLKNNNKPTCLFILLYCKNQ